MRARASEEPRHVQKALGYRTLVGDRAQRKGRCVLSGCMKRRTEYVSEHVRTVTP